MNQKGRSNSRYHSNAVSSLKFGHIGAQTRNLVVHITGVLLSMGLSPFCERTATDQRRIKSTKAKGSIFALKNSPPASAGFGFGKGKHENVDSGDIPLSPVFTSSRASPLSSLSLYSKILTPDGSGSSKIMCSNIEKFW